MATKVGGDRKSKSGKLLVAAIDFGTTFSGYAFSFNYHYESADPTIVASNTSWVAGTKGLMSLKTPTILLLDNNKKFVAFGYEAEERYTQLTAEDEHTKYYYYRQFKVLLHTVAGDHLTRDVMIPDDKGRQMSALKVFSIAIDYLRQHLMETLIKRMTGITPKDIRWVLTVPASWNDGAKQFMREAAEMAGIDKDCLYIALEPEAASLYCMNLPAYKIKGGINTKTQEISPFTKGTRFMVLDAEGESVDVTIYEVVDDGKLKELIHASGGPWKGTSVDAAFEKFLRSIVDTGKDISVFDLFMQDAKEDWIDLFRQFETVKERGIKAKEGGDGMSKVTIKVPVRLAEMFKEETGKHIRDYIKTSKKYVEKVTWAGDKVRVETGIFRSWFDESCNNIIKHVKEIFKQKSSKKTDSILLVGGFSESPFFQEAIIRNFPDKRLIIPEEARSAVLKGAVIYGHNPSTIVSRIARCSYGIRAFRDFQNGVDLPNKKVTVCGKVKCMDVFAVHVKKGQELIVGKAQFQECYTPLDPDQTSLIFDVYTSNQKDPQYVTDIGCIHIGQLEINVPDLSCGKDRGVFVQMIFGGTEVVVEATEEKTGTLSKAKFDFLVNSC